MNTAGGEEPAVPERAEGTGAVDQHRGAPSPLETPICISGRITTSPVDADPGASSAELTHERQKWSQPDARPRSAAFDLRGTDRPRGGSALVGL